LRPRFGSFADELLDLSHLTVAGRRSSRRLRAVSQAFPGTDQLATRRGLQEAATRAGPAAGELFNRNACGREPIDRGAPI
jgi:hypothetical protein